MLTFRKNTWVIADVDVHMQVIQNNHLTSEYLLEPTKELQTVHKLK
jgi:hypothetical protein